MDQRKIGQFIKTQRLEKGWTQEQLAERLGVTNRSVSRWETGANLPDLDLMLELAALFGISLDEFFGAARREQPTDGQSAEPDSAMHSFAQYANEQTIRASKRLNRLFRLALAGMLICLGLQLLGVADAGAGSAAADFLSGAVLGILILGSFYDTAAMRRLRALKRRLFGRKSD